MLLLTSCQRNGGPGMEVDPKLKGFIPAKSKALIGINIDKLKQTEFYKRHEARLAIPQLNEFSQQIGMDPRHDLSSFLLAWDGTGELAASRGTFDADQLEKRLQSRSTPHQTYNKAVLYGDSTNGFALLPKSFALAGTTTLIKSALDENSSGGGGVPDVLQLQLARVNKDAQIWAVTSEVISLSKLGMRSDMASNLSNIADYIRATATGITFGSGMALDAHLTCTSEEGAQRVNDALRGVIGLARLSTPDGQLDQLHIWDSIHVVKQGMEVHVTSELTPELADRVLSLGQSMSRRF